MSPCAMAHSSKVVFRSQLDRQLTVLALASIAPHLHPSKSPLAHNSHYQQLVSAHVGVAAAHPRHRQVSQCRTRLCSLARHHKLRSTSKHHNTTEESKAAEPPTHFLDFLPPSPNMPPRAFLSGDGPTGGVGVRGLAPEGAGLGVVGGGAAALYTFDLPARWSSMSCRLLE